LAAAAQRQLALRRTPVRTPLMIANAGNYGQHNRLMHGYPASTRTISEFRHYFFHPVQMKNPKFLFTPVHHAAQHNDMWNGGKGRLYVRVNAC
jgi:hypothetical protein